MCILSSCVVQASGWLERGVHHYQDVADDKAAGLTGQPSFSTAEDMNRGSESTVSCLGLKDAAEDLDWDDAGRCASRSQQSTKMQLAGRCECQEQAAAHHQHKTVSDNYSGISDSIISNQCCRCFALATRLPALLWCSSRRPWTALPPLPPPPPRAAAARRR